MSYGGQYQQYNQGYPPPGGPPGGQQGGYGPPGGPPGGQHGGGYGAPGPRPPPHGADPKLWTWFIAVDRDYSNHISAQELQQALVNGDWTPFDLDTVKLLMGLFDADRSGTIGFPEFSGLWKYIEDWQKVFRHFDHDRSGSIEGAELTAAMKQFGYNLSPQLIDLMQKKYVLQGTSSQARAGPPPGITFDRFVRCCVVVKNLTESFQKLDTQRSGWVQMNYNDFMMTVMHAP